MFSISILKIDKAKWDSDFLGLNVGACELDDAVEWTFDEFKKWDLVYISVPGSASRTIEELGTRKVQLVDKKVTYSLDLDETNVGAAVDKFCEVYYSGEEDTRVIETGIQSSLYSRFSVDRRFGKENCRKLYATWMRRSIDREIAKEVFVCRNEEKIITGVVTIRQEGDEAVIGILAVDGEHRGQKAGKKLLESVIKYCIDHGYRKLKVTTQGFNEAACRFYERSGFQEEKRRNVYHLWKQPDPL